MHRVTGAERSQFVDFQHQLLECLRIIAVVAVDLSLQRFKYVLLDFIDRLNIIYLRPIC